MRTPSILALRRRPLFQCNSQSPPPVRTNRHHHARGIIHPPYEHRREAPAHRGNRPLRDVRPLSARLHSSTLDRVEENRRGEGARQGRCLRIRHAELEPAPTEDRGEREVLKRNVRPCEVRAEDLERMGGERMTGDTYSSPSTLGGDNRPNHFTTRSCLIPTELPLLLTLDYCLIAFMHCYLVAAV